MSVDGFGDPMSFFGGGPTGGGAGYLTCPNCGSYFAISEESLDDQLEESGKVCCTHCMQAFSPRLDAPDAVATMRSDDMSLDEIVILDGSKDEEGDEGESLESLLAKVKRLEGK